MVFVKQWANYKIAIKAYSTISKGLSQYICHMLDCGVGPIIPDAIPHMDSLYSDLQLIKIPLFLKIGDSAFSEYNNK